WHGRRVFLAALQGDRRNAGQPLEFEADKRVLADWGVVFDHRQCDHAPRVVEFDRDNLPYPDTVKVDTAAIAQAGRRTFEHDTDRAARLGGVQALKAQHKAERGGDHCQREGPDQDVVRPRFHSSRYSGTWSVQLRRSDLSFIACLSMISSKTGARFVIVL